MDSIQSLVRNTERQLDRFFDAVKTIPADKLNWKPSANSRSVLDQVQEVATVFRSIPEAVTNRKLAWTEDQYAEMTAERQKVSDIGELEAMTRAGTAELVAFIKTVKENELEEVVEMPWPGDFRVADLLGYHGWNMAYHEGQIYMIGSILEG